MSIFNGTYFITEMFIRCWLAAKHNQKQLRDILTTWTTQDGYGVMSEALGLLETEAAKVGKISG